MPQPASSPADFPVVTDLTGRTIGRFAIRARLGAGGMGEVYRADDTALKRPVALKRIAPRLQSDESYRKRFLREAQCASGLTNQNIAGVYDVLEADGEIFVVMEFVEGETLHQRLSRPLSTEQFLGIAVQCVAALVAAHEQGIVHRDIKPENIMLTPDSQVKILDFGVAKQVLHASDAVTVEALTGGSSSFSGTPAYMAPEVLLEKEADRRTDIFSLGVVFYEALTGRHPFLAGSFMATCDRILHEVPAPVTRLNPKVPSALGHVVAKMLAKEPAERYATAADLLVDLRAVQRAVTYPTRAGAEPSAAAPGTLPAPRGKFPLTRPALLAVTIGILLITGTALLLPKLRDRGFRWSALPAFPGPKNLAVLPFQAIGGAPENQAYSDGITETLAAKLTQLTATHALQVVPAREVRTKRVVSAEEARKELGVSFVLEGTLHRSGNTVRVNYALVDTGTLRQVRADTITAEASDPFAVEDRVAAGMVHMLELELKPQERQALQSHGTTVAGAYDFYLQGRGYLQNYDRPENIDNAISVLERALRLDVRYALAYAGLGEAYWKKYEARKDSQWVEPARQSCERALTLDPQLAVAHVCLGTLEDGTGHPEKAAGEFRKALETEPTSDDAYRGLGRAYEHLGQLAEAERTYRQAIQFRPQYWAGYLWLGAFYFRQARYPEAAEMFDQVVALAPDSFLGYSNLGAIYVRQGRYTSAIAVLERSVAVRPTARAYSNLATAYFFLRRYEDAARTYEDALKLDERNFVVWGNLGDAEYLLPAKQADATRAYQKAIALAKETLRVNPRDVLALKSLAYYCAMVGEQKQALDFLRRALQVAPDNSDVRFAGALVYNRFGETDRALGWLERAVAAGYPSIMVRDTPDFDGLRNHPRFQSLLREKR